jgi:hypothetical protein
MADTLDFESQNSSIIIVSRIQTALAGFNSQQE